MHMLQAMFALIAIIFFYKLAAHFVQSLKLGMTTLFALSPAFAIGQNLMVDVPLIAAWITFYYVLIRNNEKSEYHRYTIAAIIASVAVLIKYNSLTLIPILFIQLIRKQYRLLYLAFIQLLFGA
jgi:hypothetical protein